MNMQGNSAEKPATDKEARTLELQAKIDQISLSLSGVLSDSIKLREIFKDDYVTAFDRARAELRLDDPEAIIFGPNDPSQEFFFRFVTGLQDRLDEYKAEDDVAESHYLDQELLSYFVQDNMRISHTVSILNKMKEYAGDKNKGLEEDVGPEDDGDSILLDK